MFKNKRFFLLLLLLCFSFISFCFIDSVSAESPDPRYKEIPSVVLACAPDGKIVNSAVSSSNIIYGYIYILPNERYSEYRAEGLSLTTRTVGVNNSKIWIYTSDYSATVPFVVEWRNSAGETINYEYSSDYTGSDGIVYNTLVSRYSLFGSYGLQGLYRFGIGAYYSTASMGLSSFNVSYRRYLLGDHTNTYISQYVVSAPFRLEVAIEYAYDGSLGAFTNVSFKDDYIKDIGQHKLNFSCSQYTTTGFDLENGFIESRLEYETYDGSFFGQAMKYYSDQVRYGFSALSGILFDDMQSVPDNAFKTNAILTPCRQVGNIIYYGESYIIQDVKSSSIGTTLVKNYIVSDDGSSVDLNSTSAGNKYVDITRVVNEKNFYDNSTTVGGTVYNYTTNYDNDTYTENNYYSDSTINYGFGAIGIVGGDDDDNSILDWLTDIDWAKMLQSLYSVFIFITLLFPALTQLLSFLPFWATGLIEGLLTMAIVFGIYRFIVSIVKRGA